MQQFASKFFDRVDNRGECHEWTGHVDRDGYGIFTPKKGRQWRAHRYAWELYKGPIPQGLCVCHHCDNPSCVNPEHLWVGTHLENVADMHRKRRNARKLSRQDVIEIRDLRGHLPITTVAPLYGVSFQMISRVQRREAWKNT